MTPLQADGMREACHRDLGRGPTVGITQTSVQQDTLMVTVKNTEKKKRLSIKRKPKSRNTTEDTNSLRREESLYRLTWNLQNLPLDR